MLFLIYSISCLINYIVSSIIVSQSKELNDSFGYLAAFALSLFGPGYSLFIIYAFLTEETDV